MVLLTAVTMMIKETIQSFRETVDQSLTFPAYRAVRETLINSKSKKMTRQPENILAFYSRLNV